MWSNLLYGGRNLICEHCFEQMKAWDCACLGQISFEGLFCSLTSCSEIYFFNVTWSEVFFLLSLEIVLSCILLILKEMVLLLSSEILGLCFK